MADLDTLICQNDCSGHGFCQQGIFHVQKKFVKLISRKNQIGFSNYEF